MDSPSKSSLGIAALAAIFACAALAMAPAEARIKRSQSAKVAFKVSHPCPATGARKGPCKGWIIDHVVPLCAGGPDRVSNMQWQEYRESLRKDAEERRLCRAMQRQPS